MFDMKYGVRVLLSLAALGMAQLSFADDSVNLKGDGRPHPKISFVEIQSIDISKSPPAPLKLKGKLVMPADSRDRAKIPAVVILHGSGGVDSRGDLYAEALSRAGIASLAIDMWEARGVSGVQNRPRAPIHTYPDAFAALRYLSDRPEMDGERIGVLGFSWGGVIAAEAAEQLYSAQFGGGQRFAAHVANYPVCYAANNGRMVYPATPAQAGTQFMNLTGAPLLIQIGTEDDYDNGAQHCLDLAAGVNSATPVQVEVYEGAYHAWDRLMIPVSALDPFADEGSILSTGVMPTVQIVPDVKLAYRSQQKVVSFFSKHLKR